MEQKDLKKAEERQGEPEDESPRFGKFVPWFPGLGALIVFLILRACGVFSP
jgi:hypothetical protein